MAERADGQAVSLESVLAVLRSIQLDDRTARALATDTAAMALAGVHTLRHHQRTSVLEPVVGAFSRLRNDLRPLARHGDLDIQFVEPPATGRALPGEVAQAGRAIVQSAILVFIDQEETGRVRVEWDCDGLNLLIEIRDDGRGELAVSDDSVASILERASALNGTVTVRSTPGWGSILSVRLPLDPPAIREPLMTATALTNREREVLQLVASGARNRAIGRQLAISENTVKFHVSNLLSKVGASSRAELVARAGMTDVRSSAARGDDSRWPPTTRGL
ncbi:hypothetical protein GCM10027406_34650 [Leifsonia lichenia]